MNFKWWKNIKKTIEEIRSIRTCKKSEDFIYKLGQELDYIYLGFDSYEYQGSSGRKNIYVKVQSKKYPDLTRSIRLHLLKQGQNPFAINHTSPEWLSQELLRRGERYSNRK